MGEGADVTFGELAPNPGDCVIFIRKDGRSGTAWLNIGGDTVQQLPIEVTTDYDIDDERPLMPRRFTVKAGRTLKAQREWRKELDDGKELPLAS